MSIFEEMIFGKGEHEEYALETNGQFNAEFKVSRISGSSPHMRGTL